MDNKQNVGSPDRDRINIHENYEVEYWSKEFGITPEQLREAVKNAGSLSKDVQAYLKK